MNIEKYKANNIEEFFGTLQQSVVSTWRKHLKTSSHRVHVILDDFYDEMPELVDQLIEDYMGINGKVESYKNNLPEEALDAIEYLELLRDFIEEGKDDFLEDDELESDVDNIMSLIDTTLYKLKELKENTQKINLKDFLIESQIKK